MYLHPFPRLNIEFAALMLVVRSTDHRVQRSYVMSKSMVNIKLVIVQSDTPPTLYQRHVMLWPWGYYLRIVAP